MKIFEFNVVVLFTEKLLNRKKVNFLIRKLTYIYNFITYEIMFLNYLKYFLIKKTYKAI